MDGLNRGEAVNGFIFDFNGTLFWDADKHLRAWKVFAREKCGDDLSDERYFENMEGWNDRHAFEYLFGREVSEGEVAQLTEAKEAMYRASCFEDREHMKLAEGAPELFDFLASRGIPRTIATASCKSNVDFYVKEFNLSKWFDASKIIYDDGTIPGKPAPDFYARAASAIGVPVAECAVAEDSVPGVMSAHNAGAGHITAVAPGERRRMFEGMKEVNSIIADFNEFDRNLFLGNR
jgi:beta-phosphoglucomutase-like phosphatase (HAD superfamily)